MEPLKWKEFDDKSSNEFESSNNDADKILIKVEWKALNSGSSKLNNSELHKNCKDRDVNEEHVSEQSGEDIKFFIKFSGVELVENLHHNEGLEDKGEEEELLGLFIFLHFVWHKFSSDVSR